MKNKKLLLNLLSMIGLVLLIFPMFLIMWVFSTPLGNENYGLFADMSLAEAAFSKFQGAWATIVDVVAVVALVLAVVYALAFVLEICKVSKKVPYVQIRKFLAILLLVCFVFALVCGILFVVINTGSNIKMLVGAGFYLLLAGTFVLGILGLFASNVKSTKKKRK